MNLNQFAADRRMGIFSRLLTGGDPGEGAFDETALAQARVKGAPQMGATRYEPDGIVFEFIYPDPIATSQVFTVRIAPPERIVFMPVPPWVVANIWQGSVEGSPRFESEARALLERFADELESGPNRKWFEPERPIGRA